LVAKKGEILLHSGLGMSNLASKEKLNTNHILRIGSIAQQFAAVAILRLVEAGKLSLTNDIRNYVPDFPSSNPTVTIEHLFTHTSGIKN
jgi:CubicO group peptidase (beta-lactamase class C family)